MTIIVRKKQGEKESIKIKKVPLRQVKGYKNSRKKTKTDTKAKMDPLTNMMKELMQDIGWD